MTIHRMQAKRSDRFDEETARLLLATLPDEAFDTLRQRFRDHPESLSPEETYALFLHEIDLGIRDLDKKNMSQKSVLEIAEDVLGP